jgi:hypothetical protein
MAGIKNDELRITEESSHHQFSEAIQATAWQE